MEVVSGQGVKELTVLPVPDPHRPVTSRRELSAVGTERNGICRPKLANDVARFGEHCLAGRRQVPDLHLLVRAEGGQVLAVGVERDADDCIGVRWECLDHGDRPVVPDLLLFQILTAPSPPAEASRSPSGLNATPLTSVLSRRTNGSTRQSRIR